MHLNLKSSPPPNPLETKPFSQSLPTHLDRKSPPESIINITIVLNKNVGDINDIMYIYIRKWYV